MNFVRNLLTAVVFFSFAQSSFAQSSASATATAAKNTATPQAIALDVLGFEKVGKLSVSVGTANGVLTLPNGIPVTVGPVSKGKTHVSSSSKARSSAKVNVPENGRLVIMKCDNTFVVTPTQEVGTVVHEARNCAPPQSQSIGIRIVEAPSVQMSTVAVDVPAAIASTDSIWLWHPHNASDAAPKACILASGSGSGLPPRCSSFKVESAKSGETKNAWLVRVGGGQKPTDTGLYTKK